MAWNFFRREKKALPSARGADEGGERRLVSLPAQDTRAAIDELSQVVRNNSEAVEIYLALGSLYRSQGEIERAIQIRHNLIVRPGLDPRFKARAYYELGRDFRRGGFLDRAAQALEQARILGGDPEGIAAEQAVLAAQRGDFALAAERYGELGRPLPQAHYLVRLAQEAFAARDTSQGHKLVKQALRVYPASVEAWLERLVQAHAGGRHEDFGRALREGLAAVEPGLRFVLLEGLMESATGCTVKSCDLPAGDRPPVDPDLGQEVVGVVEAMKPDTLLCYYAARVLFLSGETTLARSWFERTLMMDQDFWLARLELFGLSKNEQTLTPFFAEQFDYFLTLAHQVKRFVCNRCGLRWDRLFFHCPRCQSWHSISFRAKLTQ
ncbi:MAG: tetratricopeptide repeat protein [Desulfovibrionaceae bacterium]